MGIAIFGAGIAGLTTAIALGAHGHRCRLYERSRKSQDAGMGFILVPEVRQQLEQLGVGPCGVPLLNYNCRNRAGEVIYSEPILPGTLGVLRRDFIASLAAALPQGEAVSFGNELTGFQFDAQQRVTAAQVGGGQRVTADLYVAADGTRSRARLAMFPEWPIAPAGVQEI